MAFFIFFLISLLLLIGFNPESLVLGFGQGPILTFIHLFTSMFGHANWPHLIGNYLFTFPYALYLEQKIGWKRFVKIFLTCGICASASQFLWCFMTGDMAGMIGSSGADFGIVAMALWTANESRLFKYVCRSILAYHIFNQVSYMYLLWTQPILSLLIRVGFACHFGGICAGIYFGQKMLRQSLRTKRC